MLWIIIIYLICVVLGWLYMHHAYSEKGIWNNLTPGIAEVLFIISPFNSAFLVMWILGYPLREDATKNNKYNKFFKI